MHAIDNVGNVETRDADPLLLRHRCRRAEHDALAHERDARVPHQRSAPVHTLFYGTALGGGGFTIHVDATDASGVDTVTFPDLSATSGFGGTGGTSTNSANDDPYAVDSTGYTFSSGATTPPPPKT